MTLLTVDELKTHAPSTLSDAALTRLLADAEAEIDRFAGAVGSVVDLLTSSGAVLSLTRRAASITSIVERDGSSSEVTLAADDYELFPPYLVRRRRYGTHDYPHWRTPVRVTYAAEDDTATRKIVQAELCKIEMSFNPSLASETLGAWTQTYTGSGKSIADVRAEVLGRLREPGAWVAN